MTKPNYKPNYSPSTAIIPVGTRVHHIGNLGDGTVAERTGHTHEAYTRVTFDKPCIGGKTVRVQTAFLEVIIPECTCGWAPRECCEVISHR